MCCMIFEGQGPLLKPSLCREVQTTWRFYDFDHKLRHVLIFIQDFSGTMQEQNNSNKKRPWACKDWWISGHHVPTFVGNCGVNVHELQLKLHPFRHTVDGRNPAPVDRFSHDLHVFFTSQVVFHQQYLPIFQEIFILTSTTWRIFSFKGHQFAQCRCGVSVCWLRCTGQGISGGRGSQRRRSPWSISGSTPEVWTRDPGRMASEEERKIQQEVAQQAAVAAAQKGSSSVSRLKDFAKKNLEMVVTRKKIW